MLIDTPAALNSACNALSGAAWLALDTEFVRERTYYPALCLVQVATPDAIFCIDAVTLSDLDPLLAVVYDTNITKVLHAPRQDLEIFYHLRGDVPVPLFDTQAAAPLVGLGEQLGYAQLVQEILDVTVDKSHTRADWSRRPLADEELRYAANDVRYLVEIYPWLHRELTTRGRLEWLQEDMLQLHDGRLYAVEPEDAWRRLKGAERLAGDVLARVKVLAAWREDHAQNRDLPRLWVLRDSALLEIARRGPMNNEALAALPGVPKGLISKHGERLLALLSEIQPGAHANDGGVRAQRRDAKRTALVDSLLAVVRRSAEREALSPSVLASRRQVEFLLRDPERSPLLRGWRSTLMGDELSRILNHSDKEISSSGAL